MSLPRKSIGLFVIVVLLGAAGYGVYYRINAKKDSDTKDTADTPPVEGGVSAETAFSTDLPIAVEGAQVIKGDLILEVTASGQAVPTRGTVIRSQVAGRVLEVPVRENTPVRAGALLVHVDSTEIQLNLEDAQSRLRQAENQYRVQMIGNDLTTDPVVRKEREDAARLQVGLGQAEVAVKREQLNLARTRITAPFGGRVASVKIVEGQDVGTGEEVMQVLDIDPIRIEVQVNEPDVGKLSVGGGARLTFAAFPGEQFTGRIVTINPVVDNVKRQAKVTVTMANPSGRILPGMFADVVLDARHIPNSILVPRDAVLERDVDRRTLVFVFDGTGTEGTAEWRYVTTGQSNSKYVQIVENPETNMVEPGEIVLVAGHTMLTHGARIQLTENIHAAQNSRPR